MHFTTYAPSHSGHSPTWEFSLNLKLTIFFSLLLQHYCSMLNMQGITTLRINAAVMRIYYNRKILYFTKGHDSVYVRKELTSWPTHTFCFRQHQKCTCSQRVQSLVQLKSPFKTDSTKQTNTCLNTPVSPPKDVLQNNSNVTALTNTSCCIYLTTQSPSNWPQVANSVRDKKN